jgi:hypothetical protein
MTIIEGTVFTGVVKKVFDLDPPVYMVEFTDGQIGKVRAEDIAPAPEEKPDEEKPVDGKQITREAFTKALAAITDPDGKFADDVADPDFMSVVFKSMGIYMIGARIRDKLFGEAEEINLTRERLSDAIAEGTGFASVGGMLDNGRQKITIYPVVLLSSMILNDIVGELFGEAGE